MLKNYYSIYKYGNWLVQHHVPVLPAVLKLVSRIFFPAYDIPFTAKIGKKKYTCKVKIKANKWTTSVKYQQRNTWDNIAYCNKSQLCFVKARLKSLQYNPDGSLTAKIVLLNQTYGRNYYLNAMDIAIKYENKIIASGRFYWNNCSIQPLSYDDSITVRFTKDEVKKVVNLTKYNSKKTGLRIYFDIATN